jgi:hypothetical protein
VLVLHLWINLLLKQILIPETHLLLKTNLSGRKNAKDINSITELVFCDCDADISLIGNFMQ